MKIGVTGYPGQMAMSIEKLSNDYPNIEFSFYHRSSWDITNFNKSAELIKSSKWDYLINCAAYTQVDLAESDESLAYLINSEAVGNLADLCRKNNCHLIHFSTDYIYDNGLSRPLCEEDIKSPKSVYASSKLQGEKMIIDSGSHATIVRTSWVYSPFGHNFVKTMIRLLREKKELRIVADQWGCPTSASELAHAIVECIVQSVFNKNEVQIFNYTERGWTSWYEMSSKIKDHIKSTCKLIPIATVDYPTPAHRPLFSVLNCNRFDSLGINKKRIHWEDALIDCISSIENTE